MNKDQILLREEIEELLRGNPRKERLLELRDRLIRENLELPKLRIINWFRHHSESELPKVFSHAVDDTNYLEFTLDLLDQPTLPNSDSYRENRRYIANFRELAERLFQTKNPTERYNKLRPIIRDGIRQGKITKTKEIDDFLSAPKGTSPKSIPTKNETLDEILEFMWEIGEFSKYLDDS